MSTEGTFEFLRDGDRVMHRCEQRGRVATMQADGSKVESAPTVLQVSDGVWQFSATEEAGQLVVYRFNADRTLSGDVDALVMALSAQFDMTLESDAEFDGAACYVVEATPRSEAPIARQVLYFRQDCGINVRMLSYGADDSILTSSELLDVEVDVELDPKRFYYVVPNEARLVDLAGR